MSLDREAEPIPVGNRPTPMLSVLPLTLLIFGTQIENGRQVTVNGNDQVASFDGDGRDFRIKGNDSRITIRGKVKSLTVNGNGHRITLVTALDLKLSGNDNAVNASGGIAKTVLHGTTNVLHLGTVSEIRISGVDNKAFYRRGLDNRRPIISAKGVDNHVSREK